MDGLSLERREAIDAKFSTYTEYVFRHRHVLSLKYSCDASEEALDTAIRALNASNLVYESLMKDVDLSQDPELRKYLELKITEKNRLLGLSGS